MIDLKEDEDAYLFVKMLVEEEDGQDFASFYLVEVRGMAAAYSFKNVIHYNNKVFVLYDVRAGSISLDNQYFVSEYDQVEYLTNIHIINFKSPPEEDWVVELELEDD